jgi:hypothetical protein
MFVKYAAEIFNTKAVALYEDYLLFTAQLGSNYLNTYQIKTFFEKNLGVGLTTPPRKQRVSYEI